MFKIIGKEGGILRKKNANVSNAIPKSILCSKFYPNPTMGSVYKIYTSDKKYIKKIFFKILKFEEKACPTYAMNFKTININLLCAILS